VTSDDLSVIWPAPAKLNLMLRIVGRRADGYHLLQTVFQLLDHGDALRFAVRPDGEMRRLNEVPGVPPESDLVVRAARLLKQATGCRLGADVAVDKRVPMGGGLGGGSSDAATTLLALNRLWGLGLDQARLAALGLSLGADVPVFVWGRSAWSEGVGEMLTPIDLPETWYAVVRPPCAVSTAAVFADPELTRNSPVTTISTFFAGSRENDCLGVVRRRYPPVAAALDWLGRFGVAQLTGTGSCVFAAFEREAQARAVIAALPAGHEGFAARGINRSPVPALAGLG
jgi:4-diphosphocytidyl-2-C-methyl-D-erythritol kinase